MPFAIGRYPTRLPSQQLQPSNTRQVWTRTFLLHGRPCQSHFHATRTHRLNHCGLNLALLGPVGDLPTLKTMLRSFDTLDLHVACQVSTSLR
ncbi:hypothetical protein GOODEAATRI_019089, partial [Goodea atripinnis]